MVTMVCVLNRQRKERLDKKTAVSVLLAALILASAAASTPLQAAQLSGTLSLSGAWAIYPLVVKWAEAFKKANPKVKMDISAGGAGKGMADALVGAVDIGMVSREVDKTELAKGALPILIVKDAVFPTISARNPAVKRAAAKGMSRKTLVDIYVRGTVKNWRDVGGANTPIHAYTRSDACGAASAWAAALGKFKQDDLKGIGVYGDPGLLAAVVRDPLGMGYNNLSYVFTGDKVARGIAIVPIDANNNGKIDAHERIDSLSKAEREIASGRYIGARREYLMTKGKPKPLARAFIEFALSDAGNKIVKEVGGYVPLSDSERAQQLRKMR